MSGVSLQAPLYDVYIEKSDHSSSERRRSTSKCGFFNRGLQSRKGFALILGILLLCLALVGAVFYFSSQEEEAQDGRKIHFVGSMASVVQVQQDFSYSFKVIARDPVYSDGKVKFALAASSPPLPEGLTLDGTGLLQGVVKLDDPMFRGSQYIVRTLIVTAKLTGQDFSFEAKSSFSLVVTQPNIGVILHVTDIHYKPEYTEKALYCTPLSAPNLDELHLLSTGPSAEGFSGSKWGTFGCDSPVILMESVLQAMDQVVGGTDPSAIILTGDLNRHGARNQSSLNQAVSTVKQNISSVFPSVPVVASIGNNDVFPNYISSPGPGNPSLDALAAIYSASPSPWLKATQNETFKQGGFLSQQLSDNLVLIALNTVLYAPKNNLTEEDPAGQFKWLESELEKAQTGGGKVWITGHIPPGFSAFDNKQLWQEKYSVQFLSIVSKYQDVIAVVIMGHLHSDEFFLLPSVNSSSESPSTTIPSAVVLNTPAVSPIYLNNPSFRVFLYDKSTLNPIDYLVLYTDLESANDSDSGLAWQLEYVARSAYSMDGLAPNDFLGLLSRIRSNETLWSQYLERVGASSKYHEPLPEKAELCAMDHILEADYHACLLASSSSPSPAPLLVDRLLQSSSAISTTTTAAATGPAGTPAATGARGAAAATAY